MAEKKVPRLLSKYLGEIGKIGGKRSLKTMTPAERTARAKKAAAASAKVRKAKASQGQGRGIVRRRRKEETGT
jgi:hypothetical protein